MTKDKIDRINALYAKSQTEEGLTDEERKTLTESRNQKEIFEVIKAAGLWEEGKKENC